MRTKSYSSKFIALHETFSNDQKIKILFDEFVRSTYVSKFSKNPQSVEDAWIKIEAKFNQGLDPENLTEEQRKSGSAFFRDKLQSSNSGWVFQGSMFLADLNQAHNLNADSPLITTESENTWGTEERVSIPFTLAQEKVTSDLSQIREITDQVPSPEGKPNKSSKTQTYALLHVEKDSAAATMLISPLMGNDGCLFHEMGCWNGGNSINNLMYFKSKTGRFPKNYLGTDINPRALGLAKMTFDYFDLPVQSNFYAANATQPFELSSRYPNAQRIVQLALRVIPVLDFKGANALFSVARNELKNTDSYFVVSYSLPEGPKYHSLIKQLDVASSRRYEKFGNDESGSLFDYKRVVNTFYTAKEFEKLAKNHSFNILSSIRAEESNGEIRNVSLLKPS